MRILWTHAVGVIMCDLEGMDGTDGRDFGKAVLAGDRPSGFD